MDFIMKIRKRIVQNKNEWFSIKMRNLIKQLQIKIIIQKKIMRTNDTQIRRSIKFIRDTLKIVIHIIMLKQCQKSIKKRLLISYNRQSVFRYFQVVESYFIQKDTSKQNYNVTIIFNKQVYNKVETYYNLNIQNLFLHQPDKQLRYANFVRQKINMEDEEKKNYFRWALLNILSDFKE